jgi:hypothetical protein
MQTEVLYMSFFFFVIVFTLVVGVKVGKCTSLMFDRPQHRIITIKTHKTRLCNGNRLLKTVMGQTQPVVCFKHNSTKSVQDNAGIMDQPMSQIFQQIINNLL